jgi:hypothetical protein
MDSFKNLMFSPTKTAKDLMVEDIESGEKSLVAFRDGRGPLYIGHDIEMLLLNNTKDAVGSRFLPASNIYNSYGVAGLDGRHSTFELRTTAAEDPLVLVENTEYSLIVADLIKRRHNYSDYKLYGAGSYVVMEKHGIKDLPESIGTHIHFGMGGGISKNEAKKVVSLLDVFLSPVVSLFEPKYGKYYRRKYGFFGSLSDYRMKHYGFEYRSLPTIIDNKDLFTGVYCLAKAICTEVLMRNYSHQFINKFSLDSGRIDSSFYLRKKTLETKLFCRKYLTLYPYYKKEIDTLFSMALEKNPTDYIHNDVFTAWNIKEATEAFIKKEPLICSDITDMEGAIVTEGPPMRNFKNTRLCILHEAKDISDEFSDRFILDIP